MRATRSVLRILLGFIALTSHGEPAYAQWQPAGLGAATTSGFSDGAGNFIGGGSTKVDTSGTILWTVAGGGSFAGPDPAGGMLRSASGQRASRVSAAGSVLWDVQVISYFQFNTPAFAVDAAGNSFIFWRDTRTGTIQLFVQKVDVSGAILWQAGGVLVTNIGVNPGVPLLGICADEAGGCYVAWQDFRPGVVGTSDLYMQRVSSGGTVAWVANGIAVCNAAGAQSEPALCSDGAGGAIVSWLDVRGVDKDIYMQRVDPSGASLWTPNGEGICTASNDQGFPAQISDGAGGVFVTWSDARTFGTTNRDIYAQRVNASGVAQWTANGVPVCTSAGDQNTSKLAPDEAGGVFIAWAATAPAPMVQHLDGSGNALWALNGLRPMTGSPSQVSVASDGTGGAYAGGQGALARVLPSGESGWAANWRATITAVTDAPGDEGGYVQVNFNRPPLSDGTGYSVWRKRPGSSTPSAAARVVDHLGVLGGNAATASVSSYLSGYTDFPPGIWDAVGYLPALVFPSYSVLVPTHTDSSSAASADDEFVVIAHSGNLLVVSAAGSGHSVDNLPPGIPENVAGGITGPSSAQITWSPNPESDLWHYAVYRGTSPSFVPSPANRLGQPTTLSLDDAAFEPGVSHYKISAFDRHGNESSFALLTPAEIVSVPPGTLPSRTYLASPWPNPSRGETIIEYGIAQAGRVSLTIYDLRGRHVARLVETTRSPGVWREIWRGLDEGGRRVSAGVYLARLTAPGVTENRKIVMSD